MVAGVMIGMRNVRHLYFRRLSRAKVWAGDEIQGFRCLSVMHEHLQKGISKSLKNCPTNTFQRRAEGKFVASVFDLT